MTLRSRAGRANPGYMFLYLMYMDRMREEPENLDVPALLHEIHHRVEAAEKRRITHAEMALRLGISKRTYVEYLRGTNRPKGLGVMFHLLQMLDREDLLRLVSPLGVASEPGPGVVLNSKVGRPL